MTERDKQMKKKQQKRKQKYKNRSKQRSKPRNSRPIPQFESGSMRSRDHAERFYRDVSAAGSRLEEGDLLSFVERLYAALADCTDPVFRQSAPYKSIETQAASALSNVRGVILGTKTAPTILARATSLGDALHLHVLLVLAEVLLETEDVGGVMDTKEMFDPPIRSLEHHDEGGLVALRNLAGARLFELGHSADAEREWRAVRAALLRSGRLDAGAERLLASNAAISRWRMGDRDDAITILQDAIESAPPISGDAARSLYPLVGYAELLRDAGRTEEASRALEQLNRLVERLRPLPATQLPDERKHDVRALASAFGSMDVEIPRRTYFPPCQGPEEAKRWESTYEPLTFSGASPGVLRIDWSTPEELLALHGPNDPLFIASSRLVAAAAVESESEPDFLAIQHLEKTRLLLEQQAPNAAALAEVCRAQEVALQRMSMAVS